MTTRALEALAPRQLLAHLLDTPHLAQVVQSLEPKVLHQLVRHCGLEDCAEIVSVATPEQLMRVFDDDLWRSDGGGGEDQFDADRFGLWLEVLAETGVSAAAHKIAAMDFDFVTAALSRHLLVLDQESLLFGQVASDTDADDFDPVEHARAVTDSVIGDSQSRDIGGFKVIATSTTSWDALLGILTSLDADHPRLFGRLMTRCSHLTTEYLVDNGGLHEVLTADEQVMADIAEDREQRREQEGYIAPSQAAAFLKLCRQGLDGPGGEHRGRDPVTEGYFRELAHRAKARGDERGRAPEAPAAGFLAPPPLPQGMVASGDRLGRIRAQLQFAMEHDGTVYARRTEELAYLANVLIAGCSFESRRFGAREAADAVLATCNLGLENWPRPAAASAELPPSFLLGQDLVTVFRLGWSVLYEKVGLHVAARLVEILSDLRCDDDEVQDQLKELYRGLKAQVEAGTPWRERDNLDVIAILDQPSWATLLRLMDECPTMPKLPAPRVDGRPPLRMTSQFEFISENRQIAWVHDFVESLPERLVDR